MQNKNIKLASLAGDVTTNRNLQGGGQSHPIVTEAPKYLDSQQQNRSSNLLSPIQRRQNAHVQKHTSESSPRAMPETAAASISSSLDSFKNGGLGYQPNNLLLMEKLRLKLKEFEIENDRLRKKIQLAEESVKIAKENMNSSGITEPEPIKRDMSTQTKKDSSHDRDLSSMRKQLESNEQKLLQSIVERDAMLKNMSDISREYASLQALHKYSKDQFETCESDYLARIQSLESAVNDLSSTNMSLSQKIKLSSSSESEYVNPKIRDIYRQFQVMKKDFAKLKATADIYAGIQIGKQNDSALGILSSKIELIHCHYKNQLADLTEKYECLVAEKEELVKASTREAARVNSLEDELSSLKAFYKMEKDAHELAEDKLSSMKASILSDASRFQESLVKIKEREKTIHQLQYDLLKEVEIGEKRGVQIQTAMQQVIALQNKHLIEIQAVRHDAHVKDLTRVANIREITLERDKVLLELQNAREVTNALSFSLKTAEASLADTNPELVEKLVDGRNKRLKELEKASNAKAKDLDQRSAETNSVSSTHLEAFREKATKKMKEAQDESRKHFDSLKETLTLTS